MTAIAAGIDSNEVLYKNMPWRVKIDGVVFLTKMSPEILNKIRNFQVRDDDIWINTYPRSGTVWTRYIVQAILSKGNIKELEEELTEIRFFELHPNFEMDLNIYLAEHDKMKSPRVFTTHLPYDMFPKQALEKNKIIRVLRNPKDALVSIYHLHQSFMNINYDGTWNDFFRLWMNNQVIYGSWFDNVLSWWNNRNKVKHLLFIKYEDLHKDLRGNIKKIDHFLGKDSPEETIDIITNSFTFKPMKTIYDNSVGKEFAKHFNEILSPFMRKGIVGDWKNHFTAEESKEFDAVYAAKMKDTGLELNFEL